MRLIIFLFCTTFLIGICEALQKQFNVLNYGAVGDGVTDNTLAFRKAAEAAQLNAGGEIYVPAGRFLTGGFYLYSHMALHVAKDAVIYASDNVDNYFCVTSITWDTGVCDYALINVVNSTNVQMKGPGSIDGGANSPPGHLVKSYDETTNFFYPVDLPFPYCTPFNCRIKLLVFYNVSHIAINEGLQLLNSPFWTLQFGISHDIVVEDVIINADRRWPNNDGIDIVSSHDVRINRCQISTGDDAVDLSTHLDDYDTFNVVVSNSHIETTSAAQNIGMFVVADVYNAHFVNNTIANSNRGLSIIARIGSGNIYNISYENIILQTQYFSQNWWGSAEPIYITGLAYNESTSYTGQIHDISYKNITANSTNSLMMRVNRESSIRNILLQEVNVVVSNFGNVSRPCHDWRPGPGELSSPILSNVDGVWMGDNEDGSHISNILFKNVMFSNIPLEDENFWGQCFNSTNVITEGTIKLDEASSCQWRSSV